MTPVGAGLNPRMVPIVSTPPPKVVYQRQSLADAGADPFQGPPRAERRRCHDHRDLDQGQSGTRQRNRPRAMAKSMRVSLPTTTSACRSNTRAIDFDASINNKSETKGKGEINRRESELLVAAVVTEIMPNGNLAVIGGSQEVQVNYESVCCRYPASCVRVTYLPTAASRTRRSPRHRSHTVAADVSAKFHGRLGSAAGRQDLSDRRRA